MRTKKGLFFTLDGVLALLVLVFLLSLFYFPPWLPGHGRVERSLYLHSIALSAHRSGLLERSISSPMLVVRFLASLPPDTCVDVRLLNESGPVWFVKKPLCQMQRPLSTREVFISDGKVYVAEFRINGG